MTAKKTPQKPPSRGAFAALQSEPFSGLTVGDEIPPLTRGPVDRVRIARYAGAVDEFSAMNLDDAGARAGGMPQVMAQPMLAGAWCAQMLTDWLQGGRVVKIDLRFVKIVWPGDAIVCHGRVSNMRRDGERSRVEVDVWAENQRGELVIRGASLCELKPGALLLRPPQPMVPRKAPPPLQMPQPPKKAESAKSTPAKKPKSKAAPKKKAAQSKPKTKKAAPARLAAKRSKKKGSKK